VIEARFRMVLGAHARVLSATDDIEALLGYSVEDFVSGRVLLADRIHPHDQDIADRLFACDRPPRFEVFNLRLRQASGPIRCVRVECTRTVADTDDNSVLELLLQDAKGLARTLDEASATVNFQAMMENTDDYFYFKDRNHVFTGASQTWCPYATRPSVGPTCSA
jgi:hypothetical protein